MNGTPLLGCVCRNGGTNKPASQTMNPFCCSRFMEDDPEDKNQVCGIAYDETL